MRMSSRDSEKMSALKNMLLKKLGVACCSTRRTRSVTQELSCANCMSDSGEVLCNLENVSIHQVKNEHSKAPRGSVMGGTEGQREAGEKRGLKMTWRRRKREEGKGRRGKDR